MSLNIYYKFLDKKVKEQKDAVNNLGLSFDKKSKKPKIVKIKSPKKINNFSIKELNLKQKTNPVSFTFVEFQKPPKEITNPNVFVEFKEEKDVKIPFKEKQKIENPTYDNDFAKNVLRTNKELLLERAVNNDINDDFVLQPLQTQLDEDNYNLIAENYNEPFDNILNKGMEDIVNSRYGKKILRLAKGGRADFKEHPLTTEQKLDIIQNDLFKGNSKVLTEDEQEEAIQFFIDKTNLALDLNREIEDDKKERLALKLQRYYKFNKKNKEDLKNATANKVAKMNERRRMTEEDRLSRERMIEEERQNKIARRDAIYKAKMEDPESLERTEKLNAKMIIKDNLKKFIDKNLPKAKDKVMKRKRMNEYIQFLKNRDVENEIRATEGDEDKIIKAKRVRIKYKKLKDDLAKIKERNKDRSNKINKMKDIIKLVKAKDLISKAPLVERIRAKRGRPPEEPLPQPLTQSTEEEEEEFQRPEEEEFQRPEEEEDFEAKTPEEAVFTKDKEKDLKFHYKGRGSVASLRHILADLGFATAENDSIILLRKRYALILYRSADTEPIIPGIPQTDVKTLDFVKALSYRLLQNYNSETGKEELYNTLRESGYALAQSVDRMSRIDVMGHYIRFILRRQGLINPVAGSE